MPNELSPTVATTLILTWRLLWVYRVCRKIVGRWSRGFRSKWTKTNVKP